MPEVNVRCLRGMCDVSGSNSPMPLEPTGAGIRLSDHKKTQQVKPAEPHEPQ